MPKKAAPAPPPPDHIEETARLLFDAYYLDARNATTWPPENQANMRGWRRAAAQAIDLAREGRL